MIAHEKFPIFQFVAVIAGCLNVLAAGMQYGWPSVALPHLLAENSPMRISGDQGSWIASIVLVGAIAGSCIIAVTMDILGPKKLNLYASVLMSISWIIVAFSTSLEALLIGRFLGGFADSCMYTCLPIYFAEISNPNIRGLLSLSIAITNVSGVLSVTILAFYIDIQMIAIIAAVFPVLSFLGMLFMPESHYNLIMKNNHEEACRSVMFYKSCSREAAELEIKRIKTSSGDQKSQNKDKYLDLFRKKNRKVLGLLLGTRGFQQLSGALAITFYVKTIFQDTEDGSFLQNYGSVLYFGSQATVIVISSAFVDKFGRRPLMLFSITGTTLSLFMISCYFYAKIILEIDVIGKEWILIVGMVSFTVCFGSGMCSVPLILLAEILPSNVKAFAICLSDMYFAFVVVVTSKFFQFTKDEYGLHVPFSTFCVISFIGIFYIARFVPETKGKTLEDIQNDLKSK